MEVVRDIEVKRIYFRFRDYVASPHYFESTGWSLTEVGNLKSDNERRPAVQVFNFDFLDHDIGAKFSFGGQFSGPHGLKSVAISVYGKTTNSLGFTQVQYNEPDTDYRGNDRWNPYKTRDEKRPKGPVSHFLLGIQVLLGALCFPAAFYVSIKAATKLFYGGDSGAAFLKFVLACCLMFGGGVIVINAFV